MCSLKGVGGLSDSCKVSALVRVQVGVFFCDGVHGVLQYTEGSRFFLQRTYRRTEGLGCRNSSTARSSRQCGDLCGVSSIDDLQIDDLQIDHLDRLDLNLPL